MVQRGFKRRRLSVAVAVGQEVSGYIDYGCRLKSESFEGYFEGRKRLMPKLADLSYLNWETLTCTSNASSNFQVLTEGENGLLFKNKRDRKIISVDPTASPGDNTTRTELTCDEYLQVGSKLHAVGQHPRAAAMQSICLP
eukprot:scaffold4101_cov267-Pinguiococcus_pyrenoidosus.AAC.7